jgi:hypothetical protein
MGFNSGLKELKVVLGYFFPMARQPLVGQCLLIIAALQSPSRHTIFGKAPLDE